jgi:hypothetical protein
LHDLKQHQTAADVGVMCLVSTDLETAFNPQNVSPHRYIHGEDILHFAVSNIGLEKCK